MALFGPQKRARSRRRQAALAAAGRMAEALDPAEPRAQGRARRATSHGHRPAFWATPSSARWATAPRRLAHRDRRRRQRCEPPRGAEPRSWGCELIVSEQLALRAGAYLEGFPLDEVDVRGRWVASPSASSSTLASCLSPERKRRPSAGGAGPRIPSGRSSGRCSSSSSAGPQGGLRRNSGNTWRGGPRTEPAPSLGTTSTTSTL